MPRSITDTAIMAVEVNALRCGEIELSEWGIKLEMERLGLIPTSCRGSVWWCDSTSEERGAWHEVSESPNRCNSLKNKPRSWLTWVRLPPWLFSMLT